jgi:hypothetical protein
MKEAEENAEELPEVTDTEATDEAKEVTEGDNDTPETAENPTTSATEPENK